ncbi:MAG: hypothetical protein SCH10_00550 [Nitrosomonadaceae bacterium]|nr:hypothetical protein [Nitrosomonadaceae bacterium]
MKKTVISLAVVSCFALGATLAQANSYYQNTETGKFGGGTSLNTSYNCCAQYTGQSGARNQSSEVGAPGAKVNSAQSQSFAIDPGYKNDDGNRMSFFRRANAVVSNVEPTDTAKYGAGKDAVKTHGSYGIPYGGTGDTKGEVHFSDKSGHNQWLNK